MIMPQIAPLISALMGAHMPVNNVGTVPLPYIHAPAYSSRHARLLLQVMPSTQCNTFLPYSKHMANSTLFPWCLYSKHMDCCVSLNARNLPLVQNSIQILRVLELKEALKRKTTFSATFRPYPPSKGGALRRMVC